jgi:uncharacterized protein involved in exopolysaccharide biosynthesis
VFEAETPSHLRDYIAVVRRHFRLAVTCFAATLALAVIVTILMPRRYTASTRVQVGRQSAIQLRLQQNVISLDDGDRGERGALTFVGTQATALKSRDLAERVIKSYGLAESPAFLEPAKHRRGAIAVAHDVQEIFRARGLSAGPAPRPSVVIGPSSPVDPELLDRYMEYLFVKQVQGTDLIDVTFVTPSPTLSAFLAAAHTQAYLEANEEARHATDLMAQGFLGRKLAGARKKVKLAEAALDRFAERHPDVAVDQEHRVGGQRIAELSSLLTKAEAARVGLESRYDFLTRRDSDPLAYFLDSPPIEKLRLALLDVRAQRAGFDARLGDNHPRMIELKRLEAEIGNQLKTEVGRGVASVRAHYDAAREREDRLRRKLEQQQEVGTEMNRLAARYELLRNDVQTARSLHTSPSSSRWRPPPAPTSTRRTCGSSSAPRCRSIRAGRRSAEPRARPGGRARRRARGRVRREYFDHSVRSSSDVEDPAYSDARDDPELRARARGGRVAAPPATNGDGAGRAPAEGGRGDLIVLHEPDSAVAEAFRSMRTALLFSPRARARARHHRHQRARPRGRPSPA